MKIGIQASNSRKGGGQFQFLIMFLDALFAADIKHEIYLFYFHDEDKLRQRYQKERWHWIDLNKELPVLFIGKFLELFKKPLKSLLCHLGITVIRHRKTKATDNSIPKLKRAFLSKYKLDFMFFPTWTDNCWEYGVPFVFIVHDVQHRLQPEFPEVSIEGEWIHREKIFSKAISKAKIVLADSEEEKKNVLHFYDCEPKKVKVLPYTVPSSSIIQLSEEKIKEIVEKMNTPVKFLFYPANFWPHKNHYRIIEAIGLLKKKYRIEIPIVFVGKAYSQWQVLAICKALAKKHSIESQVCFLNYVSDEELAALYMRAVGLVMPTYSGPTNIPYMEAFYYKCPVIASDIPGSKEQIGDAGLLVDPRNTDAIADAIYRIWTDQTLREKLIKKGQKQLEKFSPEHFRKKVNYIIEEMIKI